MKDIIKVAFLSSVITAALMYVLLEWRPLGGEPARPPEVSWAATPASMTVATPPETLPDDETNSIEIYKKFSPGVVNITTTTRLRNYFGIYDSEGSGSGAVIDTQGHIITNNHVVENADQLKVTLADKTVHPAKIIGADIFNDIAVIKIDPGKSTLVPIPMGTSKGLQEGQKVLAIGNPYGLQRTMTTGIISSLGRSIEAENGNIIDDVIQTDAAINPGNSGGPLLNRDGQIIGINSQILSPSNTGNIGIGFAIPVDTVRRISNELITQGYVKHAYLGINSWISLEDYPGLAEAMRFNVNKGLLVVRVVPGSAADRAGIRGASAYFRGTRIPVGGDIILEFQGKPVAGQQVIMNEIDRYKPGDKVNLTILRANQKQQVEVVLGEIPRQELRN